MLYLMLRALIWLLAKSLLTHSLHMLLICLLPLFSFDKQVLILINFTSLRIDQLLQLTRRHLSLSQGARWLE